MVLIGKGIMPTKRFASQREPKLLRQQLWTHAEIAIVVVVVQKTLKEAI
jgi:hypothetical protein